MSYNYYYQQRKATQPAMSGWDFWGAEAEAARPAIEVIVGNLYAHLIPQHTAIRQLREQGLTEPQIWEIVG